MAVRFKVGGPPLVAHQSHQGRWTLKARPPRAVGYIHNTPPNGLEWASNGPKWSAIGLEGLPNGLEMALSNSIFSPPGKIREEFMCGLSLNHLLVF